MKQPTESYKIIYDHDDKITNWICQGLNDNKSWLDSPYHTIGFVRDNHLIGGLIYHNIRPKRDLWWTIYTTDKRWCTRRVLKKIFGLAFNFLQVERISILVSTTNLPCIRLVKRLGFKQEGLLRKYRDDGSSCFFYGILKSENKWSK